MENKTSESVLIILGLRGDTGKLARTWQVQCGKNSCMGKKEYDGRTGLVLVVRGLGEWGSRKDSQRK